MAVDLCSLLTVGRRVRSGRRTRVFHCVPGANFDLFTQPGGGEGGGGDWGLAGGPFKLSLTFVD